MYNKRTLLIDHVREHATIYIFMTILFLTGIIFGAVIVNSMNFIQSRTCFLLRTVLVNCLPVSRQTTIRC